MRHQVETGYARGFWVVDSEDISVKGHIRSQVWFPVEEEADHYASVMNAKASKINVPKGNEPARIVLQ